MGLFMIATVLLLASHGAQSLAKNVENGNPVTIDCELGNPVTIDCELKHKHGRPVEWYQNSSEVQTIQDDPDSKKVILPDGSLHIFQTSFNDSGAYTCMLSAASTDDTTDELIEVPQQLVIRERESPPIEFVERPTDVALETGETVILRCSTTGCPRKQTKIYWMYDQDRFKDPFEVQVETVRENPDSNKFILYDGSLKIMDLKPEDEGVYYCMAACDPHENIQSTDGSWVHLLDGDHKVLLEVPQNTTAIVGETARIQCRVDDKLLVGRFLNSAHCAPAEWWMKRDNGTQNEKVITIADDPESRIAVVHDGSLYFSDVMLTDQGEYFCKTECDQGTLTTKSATLTVEEKDLKILKAPSSQLVEPGEDIILDCEIEHAQDGSLKWFKQIAGDNSKIEINFEKLNEADYTNYCFMFDGSLRINNVQVKDKGKYSCEARNHLDEIQTEQALVTVKEPITWMPVSVGSWRYRDERDRYVVSKKTWLKVESSVQPDFKGRIPSLTMESNGGAVAYLEIGVIYYCGGYLWEEESEPPTNQCYSLDEYSAQWTISSKRMKKTRNHFTLNRVGDKLVAIGGEGVRDEPLSYLKGPPGSPKYELTDTTEILESGGNKTWRYGPNLSFRRQHHCTVTLSDKSVIILGGMTSEWTLVDTVDLFDIELGDTVRLTSLRKASKNLACGLYNGRLIVVDKKDDYSTSSTVALDIRSIINSNAPSGDQLGSWYDLPDMPTYYNDGSTMVITPGRLWLMPKVKWHSTEFYKYAFNISSDRSEDNLLNGEWTAQYDGTTVPGSYSSAYERTTLLVPNNFRCKTC